MQSDRSKIVYTSQIHVPAGYRYANPRFFNCVAYGVTDIFLHGDWPDVEAAYVKAGGITIHKLPGKVPFEGLEGGPRGLKKPPQVKWVPKPKVKVEEEIRIKGGTRVDPNAPSDGVLRERVRALTIRPETDAAPADVVTTVTGEAVPADTAIEGQFLYPIPAEWADLPWPQLRKLATKVGGAQAVNKQEAEAAIKAELARRVNL